MLHQQSKPIDLALNDLHRLLKEIAVAIFLDIEGVFNHVFISLTILAIVCIGISPVVYRLVRGILEKMVITSLGEHTIEARANRSCLQRRLSERQTMQNYGKKLQYELIKSQEWCGNLAGMKRILTMVDQGAT